MERFIHNENIRHYRKLLEEERYEEKRNIIRKLLAEEEAKDVPASPERPNDKSKHPRQGKTTGTNLRSTRRTVHGPTLARMRATMCSQCEEIDAKIKRLRDIATRLLDQQTLEGSARLVAELEAQKAALHPE